jgi:hypothetical protein
MVVSDLTNVSASSPSNGQFLIYNSTTSKWEAGDVDALPTQATHSGKYLGTDGSSATWTAVDALPTQATHSGKYLGTDGSTATWNTLDTDANTTTKGLYEMANTISTYTIGASNNAISGSPVTVTGSLTIPSTSTWTIV